MLTGNLTNQELGFAEKLLCCCTAPEKRPVDQEFLQSLLGVLEVNSLQDKAGSTPGDEMFEPKMPSVCSNPW